MVQLREKDLPGGQMVALATELRHALAGRASLIINERADVAFAVGANGVQLGEEALPVEAARQILGPDALVGRSVHSVQAAEAAKEQGANFLIVGTMFATRSHPESLPAGPALVQRIAERCSLPLIGIGGITPSNVGQIITAGAMGVAVISNILGSTDPEAAARELKSAMMESWLSGSKSSVTELSRS